MLIDSNRIFKSEQFLEEKWNSIEAAYRRAEQEAVLEILKETDFKTFDHEHIEDFAKNLISFVRTVKPKATSIEHFLQTHKLSSQEGLAIMCLAEALLRIPDKATRNAILRDKITSGDWHQVENSDFMNRITNLGLLASSKVLNAGLNTHHIFKALGGLVRRFGTPVIRTIMLQVIKIVGQQFVMGETIQKALKRSEEHKTHYDFSYDMLGEAARTQKDADRYFESYMNALDEIAAHAADSASQDSYNRPSLSIKLSALHPRYEFAKRQRVHDELLPRCLELARKAKDLNLCITIDAEETERLMLSLEIIQHLFTHPELEGWDGLGLAVQAYQKRAPFVIDWLVALSSQYQKRMGIRLVKGAYWDSEIKRAQVLGYSDYPLYTQKIHTDVSYLYCAEKLLKAGALIFPQFATHNAQTLSAIYLMAQKLGVEKYEFQRLHGMGDALYDAFFARISSPVKCRIYAPVGEYRDLMCYLVRRLLENGANSNFVHQIHDHNISIEDIVKNPILEAQKTQGIRHPKVPDIGSIYQPSRHNSSGRDLTNERELNHLSKALKRGESLKIKVIPTSEPNLLKTLDRAVEDYPLWARRSSEERALCLEKLALLLENHYEEFLHLLVTEAHKTLPDAVAEVREAIDFCYYYAKRATELMANPVQLPSPTGEFNHLHYHGRGVFVCISPWNFPLAIFLGQVLAALVTGNTVIAKPAEVTPKIATFAVSLAHEAGIPKSVLQLVITKGTTLSQHILQDVRVTGVSFTGSTDTALTINRTLAARHAPIASFIAETGGMNAMIVDSSALPEQVVNDVIISAFQSAGQRCSALRILCVQDDVADTIQEMLIGAMQELKIGDPSILSTDVGPVIDRRAQDSLNEYLQELSSNPNAKLLHQCEIPQDTEEMHFIAPQLWEVKSIKDVTREAFGPIVHMIRYRAEHLDHIIDDINTTNYGLTFGLHTRIESTIQQVENKIRAGNVYINRSMIGAVVGVQPFGGEGFSGTGFKAGGPNYLLRFVHERTITNDVTAVGGNASLLAEV